MAQSMDKLKQEAALLGVFLPLLEDTSALSAPLTLHGNALQNREAVMVSAGYDADENGMPTANTIARYVAAAKSRSCGLLWTEPVAISKEARCNAGQLVINEENKDAFAALCKAVKEAVPNVVMVALLDHAGAQALAPVCFERCPLFEGMPVILEETAVTPIAVACGIAARSASEAGFHGIALNVCERNLFSESLAAFHRDGAFGGDFDDRTRFVRDCYTAMRMTAPDAFLSIRLCLSDGLPQPYCFGMAFEDETAPELSESVLLLQILQALYGVEMVACEVGVPGINWMNREEPEHPILPVSRLCTCIAMLDSAMQQNVTLLIAESSVSGEMPFENLAAGMIAGEFASLAGFTA